MRVFKFGGASVKDAAGVKNLAKIVSGAQNGGLCVVVSAIGKTTNALEGIIHAWRNDHPNLADLVFQLRDYHHKIVREAFPGLSSESVLNDVNACFAVLEGILRNRPTDNKQFDYDRVVATGELLSTQIVYQYLKVLKMPVRWLDAGDVIRTDNRHQQANVDWEKTQSLAKNYWGENVPEIVVTQGFLGKTAEGQRTTLGREGSDYSGAIFAYVLGATSLTIWKDVPGLLNADPRIFPDTIKLPKISYREALELSYYGASVIHPKTIKPLQNKAIPLYIKPFGDPGEEGSVIAEEESYDADVASYILKPNQRLLSVSPRDFSFMVEEHLTDLFAAFNRHGITANLMQNSAISFSVVIDEDAEIDVLVAELSEKYKVLYNDGLSLITIRHYNEEIIGKLKQDREVLLEQKTRTTLRFICR